jgi:phage terminase small subunit
MANSNYRQRLFAKEYLKDLNAKQAAIRAGYSAKTAESKGSQLLRVVKVQEYIEKERMKLEDKASLTVQKVVDELVKIGFANMGDYMRYTPVGDPYLDFSNLTRDQTAALSEVTVEDYVEGRGEEARDIKRVKFKLCDKRAALVDLGKHLGMFPTKVELTGKGGGPLEHSGTLIVTAPEAEIIMTEFFSKL